MKLLLAACATLLLVLSYPSVTVAQPHAAAPPTDPCDGISYTRPADAKNFLTFDRFDKELRIALTRQDAVALAFLVRFPLTVNDEGGSISLNNAAALKANFQDVFTPAVRKAILDRPAKDQGCGIEGIMYGPGVIWVDGSDRGYAIKVVNRDAVPPPRPNPWNIPKINYICQTPTHRIVVDTVPGGVLRYRAWNRPRPVTEAPDLEIAKGEGTFEGTNVCAVPVYTFKNATAAYRVEGALGCGGDNEPGPPKDATGHLEVSVTGKPPVDSWCY
jgi:hypothetical protein